MEDTKITITELIREGLGTLGLEIALGVVFMLSLYVLYHLHNDPKSKFKFEDFFMKDGKASTTSLGNLIALGVASWFFVYLAHTVKLSEESAKWYFVLFICVYSGAKIVDKLMELYFNRRNKNIQVEEDRRAKPLPKGEVDETKVSE